MDLDFVLEWDRGTVSLTIGGLCVRRRWALALELAESQAIDALCALRRMGHCVRLRLLALSSSVGSQRGIATILGRGISADVARNISMDVAGMPGNLCRI
jgi:hypothetical protein